MSNVKDSFKEAKARIKEAKKQAESIVKQAFKEAAVSVFAENPELESFSWTQYTPYFNDGDTCDFSASTEYIDLCMTDEDDGTEFSSYEEENGNKPRKKAGKAALAFLAMFDDDDLLFMFGDHARITVTESGATVDEYDHD